MSDYITNDDNYNLQPTTKGSCVNDTRQTSLLFITKDDTIIFAPEFNKSLDLELINKYKNLIFSNYALDNNLFDKYKKNTLLYIISLFNQEVNNLPNSLTHLTVGYKFNQEVNNDIIYNNVFFLYLSNKLLSNA